MLVFTGSLTRDFVLTCGKSFERSILGATYWLGMLIGSFVMGLISDVYGRMKSLMISVVVVAVAGFIGAWVTDPYSESKRFKIDSN